MKRPLAFAEGVDLRLTMRGLGVVQLSSEKGLIVATKRRRTRWEKPSGVL